MVQIGDFLLDGASIMVNSLELLLEVLVAHDIMVSAERLDNLLPVLVHDDRLREGAASPFHLVKGNCAGMLGWQFSHCLVASWNLTFTTWLGPSPSLRLRHDKVTGLAPTILVLLLIGYGGAGRFLRWDKCDLIRSELGTRDHVVVGRPLAVVLALRCNLGELRLDRIVRRCPGLRLDQTSSLLLVKCLRLVIELSRTFGRTIKVADWRLWNIVVTVGRVSSRPLSVALLRVVLIFVVLVGPLRRAFERELTLVNRHNRIHIVLLGTFLVFILT